jgi:hypothetical protein
MICFSGAEIKPDTECNNGRYRPPGNKSTNGAARGLGQT